MPLGAFLPTRAFAQDPAAIRDWTQAVEEIGYDYIDVPDHVLGVDRQARPDFDGPFVRAWAFGCYLAPLAMLELYLAAERRGPLPRFAAAAGLGLLTLAAGIGIFGAVMAMWLPRLLG